MEQTQTINPQLALTTDPVKTYDFGVCAVISEAWHKVKGSKGSYWGGIGLFLAVVFAFTMATGIVIGILTFLFASNTFTMAMVVIEIINQGLNFIIIACVNLPMVAGLMLIALRRSVDKSIKATYVFKLFYSGYIIKFFIYWLLSSLVILIPIGLFLLFITGAKIIDASFPATLLLNAIGFCFFLLFIYLAVGILFGLPLIVDRNLNPWRALTSSIRGVSQHWFKCFGLFFLTIFIVFIGLFLVIGFIWTIPLFYNVLGVTYREMFSVAGLDPVTQAEERILG